MVDIYGFERKYPAFKESIKEWDTDNYNKNLIMRFINAEIERLSPGKKNTTLCALKGLFNGTKKKSKVITKPFKDLTIDDFKLIDSQLWSFNLKPNTHRFYNSVLKRLYFFEFLDSKDEDKLRILNRLQTKIKLHQLLRNQTYIREVKENELVSVDEALIMLNRSTRPVEKGLIVVAFEGGKRPNEYLTAKVGDVKKSKDGFEISITPSKAGHGKDDKATLYIYNLKTYFAEFWNAHPFKNKPEAFLFYREDHGHVGGMLGSAGASKIIKKLATQTGLKKCVSLYSFRRGGYTWKIKSGMNDDIASRDMGWRNGSQQKRCYLNVTKEDVLTERKRLAGIFVEKKAMQEVKDKPCPWCYAVNPPGNDACNSCGRELDIKKVLETERLEREDLKKQMIELLSDKFDKLMRDPRSMKAVMMEREAQKKKKV